MTTEQPGCLLKAQSRVNKVLTQALEQQVSSCFADTCQNVENEALCHLTEACSYSIQGGGKRLRPALVYATADVLGNVISPEDQDLLAAAVECMHCYSLVHDDLPAMDNDTLRRGKPTCHIAFDEATAILVGDGLQALAFELLTQTGLAPDIKIQLVRVLAQAVGNKGMVGGQMIDLRSTGQVISMAQLELMHHLKTGALINASVQLAAIASKASELQQESLKLFASTIGLAFQVQDDILDIESDTNTLGKTQGADQENKKSTYPALLGLENAKRKASELINHAYSALQDVAGSKDSQLHELADFIIHRCS